MHQIISTSRRPVPNNFSDYIVKDIIHDNLGDHMFLTSLTILPVTNQYSTKIYEYTVTIKSSKNIEDLIIDF